MTEQFYKTWCNKILNVFLKFTDLDYKFYEVYPIEKSEAYEFLKTLSLTELIDLYKYGIDNNLLCLKEFIAKLLSETTDFDKIDFNKFNDIEITRILKYYIHKNPSCCFEIDSSLLKKFDYNPTFEKFYEEFFNIKFNYIKDKPGLYKPNSTDVIYYDFRKRIFNHSDLINEDLELKYWIIENAELIYNLYDDIYELYDNIYNFEEFKSKLIEAKPFEFSEFIQTRPSKFVDEVIKDFGKEQLMLLYHNDIKNRDFIADECEYETEFERYNYFETVHFYYSINTLDYNTLFNVKGLKLLSLPIGTKWIKNNYLNKHLEGGVLIIPNTLECFEIDEIPNFKIVCYDIDILKNALICGGCKFVDEIIEKAEVKYIETYPTDW